MGATKSGGFTVSMDDLTWLVPLAILFAAVARQVRIRRRQAGLVLEDALDDYIADCENRPHRVIRYR